ncbi:YolD-like family protein [Metasolibacillus sp. FSL K6-0083]|uniref:YolD-like family protein n=1 Tax=Metasolibacillus sp. FSL K6-0083 TaxID=2921416 RepID=UPI00315A0D00
MIRDRGNIKWTSMMLPKHLALIKQLKQEEKQQPKEFAEWELEELQQTIEKAYALQVNVELLLWNNEQFEQPIGTIKSINIKTLILETSTSVKKIPLQNIQSARLVVDFYD